MPDVAEEGSFDLAARRYRVSRHVVLGRMRTLRAISQDTYSLMLRRWQARSQPARPMRAKGGPTRVARCLSERGSRMVSLVLEATRREFITANDATTYLGVGVLDLTTLEKKVT
jgi:hypothetical protein